MNTKNIKKHLNKKLADWMSNVNDEEVQKAIKNNVIVTGGAIVSLLTGDKLHDYDVYFRTKESLITVVNYYVKLWNENHPDKNMAQCTVDESTGRVSVFIRSDGVAESDESIDCDSDTDELTDTQNCDENSAKYTPVFLTSNAITLKNKVQVVVRFYGEVEEIHKNYDFAHCTCAWSSWNNELFLPQKALECIINKELYYIGSKYPLCSIIRTRKYIERGYHINAGQYVKMAMQLNDLDLKDIQTLEDQLTGVDTGYFRIMIDALKNKQEESGEAKVDGTYVIELLNRLF